MTVSSEQALGELLHELQSLRDAREAAERAERVALLGYMDEAVMCRRSWTQIAKPLGITGTAARRWYERNRRLVRTPEARSKL